MKTLSWIAGEIRPMAAAILASLLWAGPFTCTFSVSARQVLHGQAAPFGAKFAPLHRLPSTNRLEVSISLPVRDAQGLEKLLSDLYDPASPQFHQFWTPDQFAARFGATEKDYQALVLFSEAHGLKVTRKHANRLVLSLSGSVENVEKVFHVTLHTYQHPTERRQFYAPDTAPSLDIDIPVLAVNALDNYHLPRPQSLKIKPLSTGMSPQIGSGPFGYLIGNDFRAAYAAGVTLTGIGQTVGLLQYDGYYSNDIALYRTAAHLPNTPLQNVLINGFNGLPGVNNSEVAMDIDMVMSMAPGLAKIIVYEADPLSVDWVAILSRMANDNLAKQLSCSWGSDTADTVAAEQIFKQMAAQGQTFLSASGDSGSFVNGTLFPGDSPSITQVGGTTVSLNASSTAWQSETTWNSSAEQSSGGGISTNYPIPSWQQGISMTLNQGSTTMRNSPDVSMAADSIYLICNNGVTSSAAGTSASAPLWAGLMALINQQAAAYGHSSLGFLPPALYTLGKGPYYRTCFHDITRGNNVNGSTPTLFYAVSGYDLCTGWGTPIGTNLINMLAPPVYIQASTLLGESGTPTNGTIDPGETVTLSLSVTNAGSVSVTNLVATLLPSGNVMAPSGAQTYGAIAGGGAIVARPFTFTAIGNCGSNIVLSVQLQDGSKDLGIATYSVMLGKYVTGTTFVENFDSVSAPSFPTGWTTTSSNGQSPWVVVSSTNNTSPNSAFSAAAATAGINELVSPVIPIYSTTAKLSFRHNYNLQLLGSFAGDAAVLEIKIGTNDFADITAAGGSFTNHGYANIVSFSSLNPLAGRQVWSGNSGGFITTDALLPATAAGQSIQLKWRCGTDKATNSPGWYVDTISIVDTYPSCAPVVTDLAVSQSVSPYHALDKQNLTYSITVTNAGPSLAAGVNLTNVFISPMTFVAASPGFVYTQGQSFLALGTLPAGGFTNVTVTAAAASGLVTNRVSVSSATPEVNGGNNVSTLTSVVLPSAPRLTTVLGTNLFSVALQSFQGVAYSLEYKDELNKTNWTRVLPAINGTGGLISVPDTNALLGTRFYRLRFD